jgi:hypothetical protein
MGEWLLSRRDTMIVGRHEVPGTRYDQFRPNTAIGNHRPIPVDHSKRGLALVEPTPLMPYDSGTNHKIGPSATHVAEPKVS